MSATIVIVAVFLCIPFLPFSDTYRKILGIEKPVSTEEARIRRWILEEIDRIRKEEQIVRETEQERSIVTETVEPTIEEVKPVSS
jgi:hypothetical protein